MSRPPRDRDDPADDDAMPLGRAPSRSATAPTPDDDGAAPPRALDDPSAATQTMVTTLAAAFRDHVQRALGFTLDDSETSLAFVDHYLRTARGTAKGPVADLIAAEAGAYYGELVRAQIGATWIGDGRDPTTARLLLIDQFLHFAPIDQAREVLRGDAEPDDDDDDAAPLDTRFHARATPAAATDGGDAPPDDASWLAERLAALPEVDANEYYTLTCRFETLRLVLELLATKHVGEGREPRRYTIADYVDVISGRR